MKSTTIPKNHGFDVTIICPKCDSDEHVHYLKALPKGRVWTQAPPPRIGIRGALANRSESAGASRLYRHTDGMMPLSKISGDDQWVRLACGRCKREHRVKLETLRRAAHEAWRNQWDRLTFDDHGTLVKFDDTWLR